MTTPTINPEKKLTVVGGYSEYAYRQGAHAFNSSKEYVGEVNDAGELIKPKVKPSAKPNSKPKDTEAKSE